ncbi:hypothetical protein FXO37_06276 [Capsicum annuum]|nr:hypothetical protein FXO37_06276 [Capsicum annuum]
MLDFLGMAMMLASGYPREFQVRWKGFKYYMLHVVPTIQLWQLQMENHSHLGMDHLAPSHGDCVIVPYPREIQSLYGRKTIKVSCVVWHTVAIMKVKTQNYENLPTRKLFAEGDGDKYKLGHKNKEAYLPPTCVFALIDYKFHQLACGHSITIGLTISGHVLS